MSIMWNFVEHNSNNFEHQSIYSIIANTMSIMSPCLPPVSLSYMFSQFITDKFLYDQSVAMETLLKCGLKEQLFELAKVTTLHTPLAYTMSCTCTHIQYMYGIYVDRKSVV